MRTVAEPSLQSLLIEMKFSGQALATGTGFVVTSGRVPVLVTNRHNVTGRHQQTGQPMSRTGGVPDELRIMHNKAGTLGTWVGRIEPLYSGGSPRWKEHPVLGEKMDVVALPLTQTSDIDLHPYDPAAPGKNILVGPSDPLSVVGFPFGLTAGGALAVWATGFCASDPDIDYNNQPMFLIDCRSRPGQSGSPVIAYRSGGAVAMADGNSQIFSGPVNRFLGVYSGRINAESDLGMVWKASAVAELIASL